MMTQEEFMDVVRMHADATSACSRSTTATPPVRSSTSSTPATKSATPPSSRPTVACPTGDIFGDPVVAAAILDRLMHNAIVFNMKGPSWRLREHHGLTTATSTT